MNKAEPLGEGTGVLALAHTLPPHEVLIEPMVRRALEEDLGRAGDLTTDVIVPPKQHARAVIAAREAGIVCGLIAAELAFRLVDPSVHMMPRAPDGAEVAKDAVIAQLEGPARALLTGERVALNFIGHLSGVATATTCAGRTRQRHQGARIILHPQDHAGPSHPGKIRRALRRRRQPPFRPG